MPEGSSRWMAETALASARAFSTEIQARIFAGWRLERDDRSDRRRKEPEDSSRVPDAQRGACRRRLS